jgi:secreted trypsin-like serine protease
MKNILRYFTCCLLIMTKAGFSTEVSTYIVGGTSVTTAPTWMSALYITSNATTYFCGGNLIASQWILTAAHCVDLSQPTVYAVIGQANLTTVANSNKLVVDDIIIYPSWSSATMIGDLALLHLASATTATPVTLPSLNASSALNNGVTMTIYGWGETRSNVTSENASSTNQLQSASVALSKNYDTSTYPDHIFALGSGTDTCYGDSGGPLLYDDTLYGITSFGYTTTCNASFPSGYTDISYYISWINSEISNYTVTTTSSAGSSSGGGGSIDLVLMGFFLLLLRRCMRFQI